MRRPIRYNRTLFHRSVSDKDSTTQPTERNKLSPTLTLVCKGLTHCCPTASRIFFHVQLVWHMEIYFRCLLHYLHLETDRPFYCDRAFLRYF